MYTCVSELNRAAYASARVDALLDAAIILVVSLCVAVLRISGQPA